MFPDPDKPLKVLLADDDAVVREVGAAMLRHGGHEVVLAADGWEAVSAFARESPDLVVLDYDMPVLDGVGACAAIKAQTEERFVPVLFVTGADDHDRARCLQAGGDGFLAKPYSPVTLNAQIAAFRRIRDLYATVQEQASELRYHHARLLLEQQVAERIFSAILRKGCMAAPNVRHFIAPAAIFGGDLILVADLPGGGQRMLVGDFTGHGLPAAVGGMPVSELFHERAGEGLDLRLVIADINERLRQGLPDGMFLAATLAEIDPAAGRLRIWNGGLPAGLLVRPGVGIVDRFPSRHLPLGIVAATQLEVDPVEVEIQPGDALFLHSDGLTETPGDDGVCYGLERLERFCDAAAEPATLFDGIRADVQRFRGVAEQRDDIALLCVTCPEPPAATGPPAAARCSGRRRLLALQLDAAALRTLDPIPLVHDLVARMPVLDANRAAIHLVLTELLTNAVHHGLLQLPAAAKACADGFAAFCGEVERARGRIAEGWLSVELELEDDSAGRRLTVRVADSGAGFDHRAVRDAIVADGAFGGRGILLLRSLCDRLTYSRGGAAAEAVLTWSAGATAETA